MEEILKNYKTLHNQTDTDTCKRAIRAIEIAEYYSRQEPEKLIPNPVKNALIIGVNIDRENRRAKFATSRNRLEQGMVAEVQGLLDSGIDPESLIYYGLEYKYITEYLLGRTSYDQRFHCSK